MIKISEWKDSNVAVDDKPTYNVTPLDVGKNNEYNETPTNEFVPYPANKNDVDEKRSFVPPFVTQQKIEGAFKSNEHEKQDDLPYLFRTISRRKDGYDLRPAPQIKAPVGGCGRYSVDGIFISEDKPIRKFSEYFRPPTSDVINEISGISPGNNEFVPIVIQPNNKIVIKAGEKVYNKGQYVSLWEDTTVDMSDNMIFTHDNVKYSVKEYKPVNKSLNDSIVADYTEKDNHLSEFKLMIKKGTLIDYSGSPIAIALDMNYTVMDSTKFKLLKGTKLYLTTENKQTDIILNEDIDVSLFIQK